MKNAWRSLGAALLPIVDVLLPERARASRMRKRSLHDYTLVPTEHKLLGKAITTILDYKDPAVSDLVRALKYEHSSKAADIAAEALADYLREEISGLKAFSARPIYLVPIPLHASRMRERGFNQVEKVLARLPEEFRNGILSRNNSALLRVKHTPQQAHLSRSERLKNVEDAFATTDTDISGSHIILIDDVTTTGATLVSAGKPLRDKGALVTLLALARA